MEKKTFTSLFGKYNLERLPKQEDQPLRAWDAADELLLDHVKENVSLDKKKVLIINDAFGALSVNLNSYYLHNWSDSFLSHQALRDNLISNKLKEEVDVIKSTDALNDKFDIVLIKLPKIQALFEDQLIKLRDHIHFKTQIITAGMVKHWPKSSLELLEEIIGVTKTSLTKKKARLAFTQFDESIHPKKPKYPKTYFDQILQHELLSYANVFSKDKLDRGTRFLLEQFKQLPEKKHIVDLGCGNGILGLVAQQMFPESHLSFIDESYMAIASAEENYQAIIGSKNGDFIVCNGLKGLKENVDLILCNPPFHQQFSIGDFIAWQMFQQSEEKLNSSGELWVVGNRHMNYHSKLKKLFGNCDLIKSNKSFVVLRARKNYISDQG